jgi:hypothetical protein
MLAARWACTRAGGGTGLLGTPSAKELRLGMLAAQFALSRNLAALREVVTQQVFANGSEVSPW